MDRKHKVRIIQFVLLIGIFVALFLLYEHIVPSASKYCSFSPAFDCGAVNKSPYSTLDGVSYFLTIDLGLPFPIIDIASKSLFLSVLFSVAFLGFLFFCIIIGLMEIYSRGQGPFDINGEKALKWAKGLMVFGVIFAAYLLSVQKFILQTYCVFCLTMDAVILVALILIIQY
jgi:uncharacterized membrane protein